MKKSFILSLICIGLLSYGQVGIGTEAPRGALDINQPTTNDAGLVLPTNSNVTNIKNPQTNGTPIPGTIMYDSTQDCVRLYKEDNTWSGCIGERNLSAGGGTGNSILFGTPSHVSEGTTNLWLKEISDRRNFGPTGTYNSPIMWVTTHAGQPVTGGNSPEDMENGREIYTKYNVLHIGGVPYTSPFRNQRDAGTIQRANVLADKLKDYVNRGGIMYISLGQPEEEGRRHLIRTLFREFMGFDFTYLNRTIPWVNTITTNHPVNNGPFGDVRNIQFPSQTPLTPSPTFSVNHSMITVENLPSTSEVYLVNTRNLPNPQNHEALVFSGGPGNRVIFYSRQDFGVQFWGLTTEAETRRRNFILNQTVNLINKTN